MGKKLLGICLALVLLLSCAGALAEGEVDLDATLISIAQEMTEQMTRLCGSEAYVSLMIGGSSELKEQVQSWSGSWAYWGNCRRAAVVFIAQNALNDAAASIIDALPAETFDAPEMAGELIDLKEYLIPRLLSSVGSQLSGTMGVTWMAAASVSAVSDVRVMDGLEPGYAYVLLDYFGADRPLTLSTFRIQADGAVVSSTTFIPEIEMTDAAFSVAEGSMDLNRLASDALADEAPELARAVLAALQELHIEEYYY